MLERPKGLGLAETVISDPDPEWWRNDRAYGFPPSGNDEVVIRAEKLNSGDLHVDFISPHTGWIVLRASIPDCPQGELAIKVEWNATYLALSLNGHVVLSGDPSKRTPAKENHCDALAQVLGWDWLNAKLTEDQTAAGGEEHRFAAFYKRYCDLDADSKASSWERPNQVSIKIANSATGPNAKDTTQSSVSGDLHAWVA